MFDAADRSRLGEHAVYPGTFDPVTPGHIDIIDRARRLFPRVTVLVAINTDKQPISTQSERADRLGRHLPSNWHNVSVTVWAGLTVAFCQQHRAGVIIRGVRNGSDLQHEYQLAAMNETMGITTLLLPAKPQLAATSSMLMRGLGSALPPEGCRADLPASSGHASYPCTGAGALTSMFPIGYV
jgi:pantetheine-phosphate adenylyltransferase